VLGHADFAFPDTDAGPVGEPARTSRGSLGPGCGRGGGPATRAGRPAPVASMRSAALSLRKRPWPGVHGLVPRSAGRVATTTAARSSGSICTSWPVSGAWMTWRVVHLGAMPRGDLRETLLAIREFLYMLDMYSGHLWAEALLTEKTRSALVGP
jgi:hypothetical protein